MKNRYRLVKRGERSTYYCVDSTTGKRESLNTKDRDAAEQILIAKNQALRQPSLNLQIAKAYLAGSDSGVATRTWRQALDWIINSKHGATQERWFRAGRQEVLQPLLDRIIMETTAEQILDVVRRGTVSTNVHLRKLHNFCISMNWLPWPIVPKRQWPEVRYGEKRAITLEEHQRILEREGNPERRSFYELCWHIGGSQSDIANLTADDIDWTQRTIAYRRRKTDQVAIIHFGSELEKVLKALPSSGPLFPYLRSVRCGDRATEFKQRCQGLEIEGATLHSYRYAWAQRAKKAGYPERFAMQALGHASKAIARAYAKGADIRLPSLEEYERQTNDKVVPFHSVNPPYFGSTGRTAQ